MAATVLLVEDDPITREALRAALAAEDYLLLEATNSSEAIDAMICSKPDLVLHDVGLSQVDGFALLDRLRTLAGPNATPILAFTGAASTSERLLSSGTTDFLIEPLDPPRLSQIAKTYITSRLATRRERSRRSTWAEAVGRPESAPFAQPVPPDNSKDRTWDALSTMVGRLPELVASSHDVDAILEDVLVRFLDASRFSLGAAYLCDQDGSLVLRACIGFSALLADRLSDVRGRMSFWHDALRSEDPIVLCHADAPPVAQDLLGVHAAEALLLVPLVVGTERVGALMLGSTSEAVDPSWILFAKMIAAPIGQTIALARTIARLRASEHRFRGIVESTSVGIVVTNAAGIVTFVNEAAEALISASVNDVLGLPLKKVLPFAQASTARGELLRKDGSRVQVEATARSFEDPAGQVNRVYVLRDLSERLELERVASLASRDPLTGLFNRRRLEEELASHLASSRRYGTTGALLVLDLDHFKPINDTFGHLAGDLVLRAVGDVLRTATREADLPARLGGDEFVVLLPHADASGAEVCASKLLQRIGSLAPQFHDDKISVGVSIGVALFPEHGATPDELFAAADRALYHAKQCGRNRISQPPPAKADPKTSLARVTGRPWQ